MLRTYLTLICTLLCFGWLVLVPQPVISETIEGVVCGMDGSSQFSKTGGMHLPETGTVKMLMVYVQFSDDTLQDDNPWPLDAYPGHPFGVRFFSPEC